MRQLLGLDAHDAGERLRRLCTSEFVYESAPYPETEYSFKHALTEEVAYRSQLEEGRAALHREVAGILTQADEEQLERDAGIIAGHYERGHDAAAAVQWLTRLGQRIGPMDPVEGLANQHRVLELMRELPDTPENLALRARTSGLLAFDGARLDGSDPAIDLALAAGRELLPRCPPAGVVDYLALASLTCWTLGRPDATEPLVEELFAFAAGAARADARNVLRVNMEDHGDCIRIPIWAIRARTV